MVVTGALSAAIFTLFGLAGPSGDFEAHSQRVDVHSSRTLAVIPGAHSTLSRNRERIREVAHLTEVPEGRTVTLVALIFNHPDKCVGPPIPNLSRCGSTDQTTNAGPAGYARLTGPSTVANHDGHANLKATFSGPGVTNPLGAEVIFSYSIEGCGTGKPCANDLAVHRGSVEETEGDSGRA